LAGFPQPKASTIKADKNKSTEAGVNTTQCRQAVQEQFMMCSAIAEKTSKTSRFAGFSSYNYTDKHADKIARQLVNLLLSRRQRCG
ncbi:hypothetical protein ACBQ19_20355, partial [Hafnia alvei]